MATLGAPTKLGLPSEDVPSVKLPVKADQVFHPSGAKGDFDIQVALVGYREEVLKSVGAQTPAPLPTAPAAFEEEEEDEDMDYDYDDNGEPVARAGEGLAEEVQISLA